jgi:putative transposase
MGFLKGKSSLMIYEKWGNMKFKYRNREFWCRGYYVDTEPGKMQRRYRNIYKSNLKRTNWESN